MIIAIDGPAGSGKSTTARWVANRLGFMYLDSGAMYRCVTLAFLRADLPLTEDAATDLLPTLQLDLQAHEDGVQVFMNGEDVSKAIRQPEVGAQVSEVSTLANVRRFLVAQQQAIGRARAAENGVVVEGRDIGTVVFPDAALKFFMVADIEMRAKRRVQELAEKGRSVALKTVLAELQHRDHIDGTRAVSPLRKADDALEIDTTALTIDAQVDFVLEHVAAYQAQRVSSS